MDTTPAATSGSPARADLVVAVVLLVALGLVAPVFSFFGLMFSKVAARGDARRRGDLRRGRGHRRHRRPLSVH